MDESTTTVPRRCACPINSATRSVSSIIGATLAIAGIHHGVLEIVLHGNRPTPGLFILAIGEGQLMWEAGTEGAFTLIPNYLWSGIAAVLVSLTLAWWSVLRIHTPRGPGIFLGLCVMLTLVGGGIGHIVFFLPTWAYATRIRKPLRRSEKITKHLAPGILARLWPWATAMFVIAFLSGLELSVFGMLWQVAAEQQLLYLIWSLLAVSLLCINLAYLCAAAGDLLHGHSID